MFFEGNISCPPTTGFLSFANSTEAVRNSRLMSATNLFFIFFLSPVLDSRGECFAFHRTNAAGAPADCRWRNFPIKIKICGEEIFRYDLNPIGNLIRRVRRFIVPRFLCVLSPLCGGISCCDELRRSGPAAAYRVWEIHGRATRSLLQTTSAVCRRASRPRRSLRNRSTVCPQHPFLRPPCR